MFIILGLLNFIGTVIVCDSEIFVPVRRLADRWHYTRYLVGCYLCTGVWVGFAEAACFGGPLQSDIWPIALIGNGLAFKAVGHLVCQANGYMHQHVAFLEAMNKRNLEWERRIDE